MKKREILYQGEEVLTLIPQRQPMVMVDRFFGIENEVSYSGLAITTDLLFCRNGFFEETGVIEHIAQSAAARIGYLYCQMQKPVPLGFIGSVEKVHIYKLPAVGSCLFTAITVIQEVFDITLISAQTRNEQEELIAECRMKIMIQNNEK